MAAIAGVMSFGVSADSDSQVAYQIRTSHPRATIYSRNAKVENEQELYHDETVTHPEVRVQLLSANRLINVAVCHVLDLLVIILPNIRVIVYTRKIR